MFDGRPVRFRQAKLSGFVPNSAIFLCLSGYGYGGLRGRPKACFCDPRYDLIVSISGLGYCTLDFDSKEERQGLFVYLSELNTIKSRLSNRAFVPNLFKGWLFASARKARGVKSLLFAVQESVSKISDVLFLSPLFTMCNLLSCHVLLTISPVFSLNLWLKVKR